MRFTQKLTYSCLIRITAVILSTGLCLSYLITRSYLENTRYALQQAKKTLSLSMQPPFPDRAQAMRHLGTVINTLIGTGAYRVLSIRDRFGYDLAHQEMQASTWIPPLFTHILSYLSLDAAPIEETILQKKAILGYIRVVPNMEPVYHTLVRLLTIVALCLCTGAILAIITVRSAIRRISQPLLEIAKQSHQPGVYSIFIRSTCAHIDEINQVRDTINTLSTRIHRLLEQQCKFAEQYRRLAFFERNTGILTVQSFYNACKEYMTHPTMTGQSHLILVEFQGFSEKKQDNTTQMTDTEILARTLCDTTQRYCTQNLCGRLSDHIVCVVHAQKDTISVFLVLLAGFLAEKMRELAAEPHQQAIRIAAIPSYPSSEPKTLIAQATTLLNTLHPLAKGVLCDKADVPAQSMQDQASLDLYKLISQNIRAGKLALITQPIYYVDGTVKKYLSWEIFSRLPVSNKELLKAGDFLYVVYQSHLQREFDYLVVQMTLEGIALRQPQNARYAINMSPDFLTDEESQHAILQLITHSELGQFLTLEFPAFAALQYKEPLIRFLQKAADHDIQVALDQFGLIHEGLALITSMKIAYIKIAPNLIAGFQNQEPQRQLLSAIVNIAQPLDIPVIAVGVDRQTLIPPLIELGINGVQGYLFGQDKTLFYQRFSQPHPSLTQPKGLVS